MYSSTAIIKSHRLGAFSNRNFFLGAGSLSSRCWQGGFLPRPLSLTADVSSHCFFSANVPSWCLFLFLQESHFSFNLDHLLKRCIPEYGHIEGSTYELWKDPYAILGVCNTRYGGWRPRCPLPLEWRWRILLLGLCVCVLSRFSCVWPFETTWTVACQAPLSMGFSRPES